MTGWVLISEEVASRIWNENMFRFEHYSPFQTFEQGQYEKGLGWSPQYWICFDKDGVARSMFLGLLRCYPLGFGFIHCVGGPAGDWTNFDLKFRQRLVDASNSKRLYVRVRWEARNSPESALLLKSNNWRRSRFSMTSGLTMDLDLTVGESTLLEGFSDKWRRNLRIAQKAEVDISIVTEPNPEEIIGVFAEMQARKNLPDLFSLEKLGEFFKTAGESSLFLECRDSEGELLAFRTSVVAGNRACEYFAATSEKGRELRVSFLLFVEMIRQLKSQGISTYDLGGIDPKVNPGVYRFKKETGAKEVEFLGEWDWASSEWLRWLGNGAINQRKRLKYPKVLEFWREKAKGAFKA